jgi:hypothetical protein
MTVLTDLPHLVKINAGERELEHKSHREAMFLKLDVDQAHLLNELRVVKSPA